MSLSNKAYGVERILEEEIINDKPHYLIKWQGYSALQSSWEPIENLIDVLDIVHAWKVQKKCHSMKETQIITGLKKTKRIGDKEHVIREKELQQRLNKKQETKKKKNHLTIDDDDLPSVHSSQQLDKQHDTCQLDFIEQFQVTKKSRPRACKNTKKAYISSEEESQQLPKNLSRNSARTQGQKKSVKSTGGKNFTIIGKITGDGIKEIMKCFDWGDQKICEVLLNDGRRVNMKKDDVKKICAGKLLKYYEKLGKCKV